MIGGNVGPKTIRQFVNYDKNDKYDKTPKAVARCFVSYNNKNGEQQYFWERKRNSEEIDLEHNTSDKDRTKDFLKELYKDTGHAEYYADQIIRRKIEDGDVENEKTVTIFINIYPCDECRRGILTPLAEKYNSIKFKIIVLNNSKKKKVSENISNNMNIEFVRVEIFEKEVSSFINKKNPVKETTHCVVNDLTDKIDQLKLNANAR